MELARLLNITDLLTRKSFFLFGPRATGKSTLIKQQLSETATIIDLLDSRLYLRLLGSPHDLESIIDSSVTFLRTGQHKRLPNITIRNIYE